MSLASEAHLLAAAVALGAEDVPGWSPAERAVLAGAAGKRSAAVAELRDRIAHGEDPLGDVFLRLRAPEARRPLGATYTPRAIVEAMVAWAAGFAKPARVVDPGAGSARFLVQAGRVLPGVALVGVEIDPVAAIVGRAHLAASGLASRACVVLGDYRSASLPEPTSPGRTLYIGNPPYVRHHHIGTTWKEWLVLHARSRGLTASQLAGLHVHFYLATLSHGRAGDFGTFITAAEWLDVNYGKLLRDLFLAELGGRSIAIVEPTARPFPDAASTAAITTFEIGSTPPSVSLRRVETLDALPPLEAGAPVRRERLAAEARWTVLSRAPMRAPEGFVELGELCRVHRGQVTGANNVWIEGEHSTDLPDTVLYPSVTRARELFAARGVLLDAVALRRVIDLPVDLDSLPAEARRAVDRFLRWARRAGAHRGYIARHRRAWWSVGLRSPAPILASYMARRPPAFVHNRAAARYINIAHGVYPREPMSDAAIARLAAYLATASHTAPGRTYAGGLMKYEPREMERIPVPRPEVLAEARDA